MGGLETTILACGSEGLIFAERPWRQRVGSHLVVSFVSAAECCWPASLPWEQTCCAAPPAALGRQLPVQRRGVELSPRQVAVRLESVD